MTWVPGQSGNPGGKIADKIVTEAVRLAAYRTDKKKQRAVNRMAEKIMKCACKGEPWACNFVADRLEGKAVQPISQDISIGPSKLFLEVLRAISSKTIPEGMTIDADGSSTLARILEPGQTITAEQSAEVRD